MQSVKDKLAAHKGVMTDVNLHLTPEEVEHLHSLAHPEETKKIKKESM